MLRTARLAMLCLLCAAVAPTLASAAPLPASGTLDLRDGADADFASAAPEDWTGWAVAPAGDVDGDGRGDVVIGARNADPARRTNAGTAYVIFARPGEPTPSLRALGNRGMRIDGAAEGDAAGFSVAAAGDQNGDGLGDVIVGAPDYYETRAAGEGAAYVVYGRRDGGTVDLAALGNGGFRLGGERSGDETGVSVGSVADLDGDARPELLVGAARANVGDRADAGSAFVVFSKVAAGEDVALGSLGDRGYRIDGATNGSRAGISVGSIGDLNGDGKPEVLVGAPGDGPPSEERGAAYAVYGKADASGIDLFALGNKGWALSGRRGDHLGVSVAGIPDMNGDGRPEFVAGAPYADARKLENVGTAYIAFGRPQPGAFGLEGLGQSGVEINGGSAHDHVGTSVAAAGDLNRDGVGDLLIGAPLADPLSRPDAGAAFVIFGAGDLDRQIDLSALGSRGYRMAGARRHDLVGRGVAGVGDFDGDNIDDVVIGSTRRYPAEPEGQNDAGGGAYLVAGPKPLVEGPPDPGIAEEIAAGCRAARNVEAVIDDSGSMGDTDAEELRRQAIELMLAKPRNAGEVLGALEFGSTANQVFAPTVITVSTGGNSALVKKLRAQIDADNGGTNYNSGWAVLADENPGADARIFLTDGEHNEGEYLEGHRGGPRTYVVGLGIGRRGAAALRLARIAEETGGRYFPSVTSDRLQSVMNRIDAELNCDIDVDQSVETVRPSEIEDSIEVAEQELSEECESVDVTLSWDDEDDSFDLDRIEVIDDDGADDVFGARKLRRALLASRGRAARVPGVTARRGKTYYTVRLAGVSGDRIRVRAKASRLRGGARVVTQINESRRRS